MRAGFASPTLLMAALTACRASAPAREAPQARAPPTVLCQCPPDRDKAWSIESSPPGAAIFLDGVDTGARTPAELPAPPPGDHTILLRLDGYADLEEKAGDSIDRTDLAFGGELRLRAELDREEASRRAALRPVTAAERTATRAFLGRARDRATVVVSLGGSVTAPHWELRISGDGSADVRWPSMHDRQPKVLALRVPPADLAHIFDTIVEVGWTGAVAAERRGGLDEPSFTVTVTNAAGRTVTIDKRMGDTHPRVDPVLSAVERVRDQLASDVRTEIFW